MLVRSDNEYSAKQNVVLKEGTLRTSDVLIERRTEATFENSDDQRSKRLGALSVLLKGLSSG